MQFSNPYKAFGSKKNSEKSRGTFTENGQQLSKTMNNPRKLKDNLSRDIYNEKPQLA